jgi:hypothetical protein
MLRRRIAGLLAGVTFVVLGAAVAAPSAAAASSPPASPPASSPAASPGDSGGYPAQGPMLTLSSGSVNVGGTVIVTGRGFQSGESVEISVTYPAGSHALGGSGGPVAQPAALTLRHSVGRTVTAAHALATNDGQFSTKISLTQAGNATVTATGEQSHLNLTANVMVLSPTNAGASNSTKSGFPLSRVELLILLLALIALLVPVGITLWRRSRKPAAFGPVSAA